MSVENKKVSWQVFIWALGIILIAIGWTFIRTNASEEKSNTAVERVGAVEGDIKSIKTDISWIKETLSKQYQIKSTKLTSSTYYE